MNTPGDIKNSAYGLNGPMTETFHYNINGKKIHETLDINLNSPTYGKSISVKTKIGVKLEPVSPNSKLGLAIAADEGSARQTSFLNEMQYISRQAATANRGNFHDAALKNSGMYEVANGDKPFEAEVPTVDVIEPGEVEGGAETNDVTTAAEATTNEKKFVGVLQYPANAHYMSRGKPAQDHMKIDMFQYQAPQSDYLGDYFNKENESRDAKTGTGITQREGNKFTETITGGLSRGSNIKKYLGTVKMPIPNQLATANGVSWGEGRANAFEAASFLGAFGGIRNLISGDKNVGDLLRGGVGTMGDLLGKFAGGKAPEANQHRII